MRRATRRTVLGGLAAAGIVGTSFYLNRSSGGLWGAEADLLWLRPVDPIDESAAFAFVEAAVDTEAGRIDAEVATRDRSDGRRAVELFADTDAAVGDSIPPLRGYWRFEADAPDHGPGEYAVRVGDATLPVELVAETPARWDAAVRLTPRITWRSDFVAHARGHSTADGGRVHVAFRDRTGDPPLLDAVGFRDPDGEVLGRRSIPAGVRSLSVDLDALVARDRDGELVGYQDGREVEALRMFYH